MPSTTTQQKPTTRMFPMDGSSTLVLTSPTADEIALLKAYELAPGLVRSIAPAPSPTPVPMHAPSLDADAELETENTYENVPRPQIH